MLECQNKTLSAMPPKKRKISSKTEVASSDASERKVKAKVPPKNTRSPRAKKAPTAKKAKDNPTPISSCTRKRKESTPYQQYCIKQTLKSVLKLAELEQPLEDMVQSVAVWKQDGYQLMNLYVQE